MKKLLSLLFVLLLITGCGTKTPKWEEVSGQYDEIAKNAASVVETMDKFDANDFTDTFNLLKDNLASYSNKDISMGETIFKNAVTLETIAKKNNSEYADTLISFCEKVKELVKAAYNNDSSFKNLKSEVEQQLEEISEWDNTILSQLQIKEKLKWNSVEESYETLKEETSETMTGSKQVLEYELEEYKDIIVNNVNKIKEGVNEDNKEIADLIYSSGYALSEYTKDLLEYDNANMVNQFGQHTMEYVMKCYGKNIDTSYDYSSELEQAKKYPLAIWNEIVIQLRMN